MASIYNGSFVLGNTSATTLSAQEGIKLDTSVPGVIGIGTDETVLWEGDIGYNESTTGISEPLTNFERLRIYNKAGDYNEMLSTWNNGVYVFFTCTYDVASNYGKMTFVGLAQLDNNSTLKETYNRVNQGTSYYNNVADVNTHIIKIVGINRISGGN